MKRVLIAGGAGYIGSRLSEFLKLAGYKVSIIDIGWFSRIDKPRNYISLTKKELERFDCVVVLAGHSSVAMCDDEHESAFKNNVIALVKLLEVSGDTQVIYASTAGVYGVNESLADESTPVQFRSAYDASKIAAESTNIYDQPVVYLRFGTVCGGSPHMRIDLLLNKMFHDIKAVGHVTIAPQLINRPILGLVDLCRAVQAIIDGKPNAGIYNACSFNGVVSELGNNTALRYNADVAVLQSGASMYNMRMSPDLFEKTYEFKFMQNADSILDDIEAYYDKSVHTTRTASWPYV